MALKKHKTMFLIIVLPPLLYYARNIDMLGHSINKSVFEMEQLYHIKIISPQERYLISKDQTLGVIILDFCQCVEIFPHASAFGFQPFHSIGIFGIIVLHASVGTFNYTESTIQCNFCSWNFTSCVDQSGLSIKKITVAYKSIFNITKRKVKKIWTLYMHWKSIEWINETY